MLELKDYIESIIPIPEKNLLDILSHFEHKSFKKGRKVLQKGQIATEYLFIRKGLLRIYYPVNDQEITGWIAGEGEFFCELNSVSTQMPTRFTIQAVEETRVATINRQAMDYLYRQYPEWQEFGRKLWERAFMRVVDGIVSFQTLTAEQRYQSLLQHSDLVNRLPLKHLASYLGVTPTSLSRLRKNRK